MSGRGAALTEKQREVRAAKLAKQQIQRAKVRRQTTYKKALAAFIKKFDKDYEKMLKDTERAKLQKSRARAKARKAAARAKKDS